MTPEQLGFIKDGADLQNVLPHIRADVETIQKGIVNGVMSSINKGELTPEIAQQKWIEYTAYTRLLQKMEQKVRMGQSIGEKVGGELDFK